MGKGSPRAYYDHIDNTKKVLGWVPTLGAYLTKYSIPLSAQPRVARPHIFLCSSLGCTTTLLRLETYNG